MRLLKIRMLKLYIWLMVTGMFLCFNNLCNCCFYKNVVMAMESEKNIEKSVDSGKQDKDNFFNNELVCSTKDLVGNLNDCKPVSYSELVDIYESLCEKVNDFYLKIGLCDNEKLKKSYQNEQEIYFILFGFVRNLACFENKQIKDPMIAYENGCRGVSSYNINICVKDCNTIFGILKEGKGFLEEKSRGLVETIVVRISYFIHCLCNIKTCLKRIVNCFECYDKEGCFKDYTEKIENYLKGWILKFSNTLKDIRSRCGIGDKEDLCSLYPYWMEKYKLYVKASIDLKRRLSGENNITESSKK